MAHRISNRGRSSHVTRPSRKGGRPGRFRALAFEPLESRVLLDAAGPLTGTVFEDLNENGVYDSGEPGRAYAAVKLQLENGYVEASVKTDSQGRYTFGSFASGDYIVRVLVPGGFAQTLPDGDGTYQISVGPGDRLSNLDFGLADHRGSVRGVVFKDLNENGVRDAGEPGVWKHSVALRRIDGSVATRSRLTNGLGEYDFSQVAPGVYVVETSPPEAGGFTRGDGTQTVIVGERGNVSGIDFSLFDPRGRIIGVVFDDLDGDGVRQPSEPGIAKVRLTLRDLDGRVTASTYTRDGGWYAMEKVVPGEYTLEVDTPEGCVPTFPAAGGTYRVTVVDGEEFQGLDFGMIDLRGSISGIVFKDLDRDGVRDTGEGFSWGKDHLRVMLTHPDGTRVASRTLRHGGKYSFGEVAPGDYVVRLRVPQGASQTAPEDEGGYQVSIVDSETFHNLDFGVADYRGSVSGVVFEDLNGNGVREAEEPAVRRHYLEVRDLDGRRRGSAYTNDQGRYVFDKLAPETYIVDGRLPDGYATYDGQETYEVTIVDSDRVGARDFAVVDQFELPTAFESAEDLKRLLIDAALKRYEHTFGKPWYPPPPRSPLLDRNPGGGLVMMDAAYASGDYSKTNVQVDDVDEGDLVETDGEFLYIVSGEELVIVNAKRPRKLRVASRVEFEGRPFAQDLTGNRLTVLWHRAPSVPEGSPFVLLPRTLMVSVLDVSDRQAPTILRETEFDGWLVDSRAIGNHVYLVLSNRFDLPSPEVIQVEPQGSGGAGGPAGAADSPESEFAYETREQYLQRMEEQILDLAPPQFSTCGADGQILDSGPLTDPTDVLRPRRFNVTDPMTTVVALDVAGEDTGAVAATSLLGASANEVYVSTEGAYVLQRQLLGRKYDTLIFKLDLDQTTGSVELSAGAKVPGRVLNQFSVDEYNGYLRIATTQGSVGTAWRQGDSGNQIFVLRQDGEALEIVGRLENLAPEEGIYSARFLGDRAVLVTYKLKDPLFTIDLGNPTQPRVVGELKIPGFSNYLHPVGENYLVGIGRNADEITGSIEDPKISLFDVGDFSNPAEVDQFTIEAGFLGDLRGLRDHHAVAYYSEFQVLTVPVSTRRTRSLDEEGKSIYIEPTRDLWVFRVDVGMGYNAAAGGIRLLGRIEHDSPVQRTVRIADRLYAISSTTVTVHNIFRPESRIGELHFRQPAPDALPIPEPVLLGEPVPPWVGYYVDAGELGASVTTAPVAARALPETWLYQGEGSTADRSDVLSGSSVAPVDAFFADFSDGFLPESESARALPVDAALHDWEPETAWPLEGELEPGLSDFLLEMEPGESAAPLL